MKTLKLFGLTLMAILLSVNFSSCSKDDDLAGNPEKLVGEWILIHEKYWDSEDGTDEYPYDFNTPSEDQEKLIIKQVDDYFELTHYSYSENREQWEYASKENVRIEGNKVISLDENTDYPSLDISLSGNKMTIKASYEEDGYKETMELTYQKK